MWWDGGGYEKPKDEGYDTKQNMPAVTEIPAKSYRRSKKGKKKKNKTHTTKSYYIHKESQRMCVWALKEVKDFDKWRWKGQETNSDNGLRRNKVIKEARPRGCLYKHLQSYLTGI